jgi:hypothetical protein
VSDCARCDDDSRLRADEHAPHALRKCVVCGLPAAYLLDGKPYCLQHYVQQLQRARGAREAVVR